MSAGRHGHGHVTSTSNCLYSGFWSGISECSLPADPVALAFCDHRRLIDAPVAPYRKVDVGKIDRQQ
jgi:hypothetical protein